MVVWPPLRGNKNVITFASSLMISHDEIELAISLLDQLLTHANGDSPVQLLPLHLDDALELQPHFVQSPFSGVWAEEEMINPTISRPVPPIGRLQATRWARPSRWRR